MITIPVAAPNDLFKWQISLFQFAQRWVYGNHKSFYESLVLIVDRNSHTTIVNDIDWDLKLPYRIVPGIHSILDESNKHPYFSAANLFFSLKKILNDFSNNEIICIVDADVIPLKPYDGLLPGDDTVITCNYYENWHMKCSRPDKENYNVVEPYLKHDTHEYMDGGFVPILIKNSTLKRIIDEIVELSLEIIKKYLYSPFGWWGQMWAFQIVCHNHRIKCIGQDNTYFPNINNLENNHFFAHYSCDPKFKKASFPNHNVGDFPHNDFYEIIRKWYYR